MAFDLAESSLQSSWRKVNVERVPMEKLWHTTLRYGGDWLARNAAIAVAFRTE